MQRAHMMIATVGAGLFGLGLATGLAAGKLTDTPQRSEQQRVDLSGAPNFEVIASILEIAPGESSRLHVHHGVEAYHVLQGAQIQPPGREPMSLPTGLTAMNLRDVEHGAFTVLGETPLKLLTVHIVEKDKPLYDYVE